MRLPSKRSALFIPEGGGDAFDGHHLRSCLRQRDVEDAFSLEAFAETIRDAKRGKTVDRFGVRAEHIRALQGSENGEAAIALIRTVALAIFAEKAPASTLETAGGGRLTALAKPDNRGVRPVVVVDTSRKLALSTIAREVSIGPPPLSFYFL